MKRLKIFIIGQEYTDIAVDAGLRLVLPRLFYIGIYRGTGLARFGILPFPQLCPSDNGKRLSAEGIIWNSHVLDIRANTELGFDVPLMIRNVAFIVMDGKLPPQYTHL